MGLDDFNTTDLGDLFKKYTKDYVGADMSTIAEHYLGNKVFVNILLLGVAFQRGLLPLTLHEMTEAIKDNFAPSAAKHNIDAFHLGRDLAAHPEKYQAEVREGFEEVFEKKSRILSRSSVGFLRGEDAPVLFSSSWFKWWNSIGLFRAKPYREMVWQFLKAWEGDEETRLQYVNRLYDLIQFENAAYARKYHDRVMATLKKDSKIYGFAATSAVVKYLHKVMEIKDEVYVAHLLTSPEKYEKDALRFKMDLAAGDRIVYKHFNRPEFDVFGFKVVFDMKSSDWMLNIMKHMKFLRRLMPAWHKKEKAFREWYTDLVNRFEFKSPEQYERWVVTLCLPEEVRGYRAVRYPKMENAVTLAEEILSGKKILPSSKPASMPKELSKV
jgi:indolepyruvate ferredoxin oxidoreductase